MIWTFELWFIIAVLTLSQSVVSYEDLNIEVEEKIYNTQTNFDFDVTSDYWPYVRAPHIFPFQSPVNIITRDAEKRYLPFLRTSGYWNFDKAVVNITNTGHTVRVMLSEKTNDVPFITGGPLFNHRYEFEQMHFHWGADKHGSEHEINNEKYAMEVHIVHYKKEYGSFDNAIRFNDGLCVIAIFGEIRNHDNPEFNALVDDLKNIIDLKSTISRRFKDEFTWWKNVNLRQYYYTYSGSLTTEPFKECVTWIIFTEPIGISGNQLKKFRELQSEHSGEFITANDRPIQPLNDRVVLYAY